MFWKLDSCPAILSYLPRPLKLIEIIVNSIYSHRNLRDRTAVSKPTACRLLMDSAER